MRTLFMLVFIAASACAQSAAQSYWANSYFPAPASGGGGGSLSGSEAAPSSITFPGSVVDWRWWGYDNGISACPGDTYDSSAGTSVSTYSFLGGASGSNVSERNVGVNVTWTGGAPASGGSNNALCAMIVSTTAGMGFLVTVPCGTASHTANMYGYSSGVNTFTAHLSDSSASDYTYSTADSQEFQFTLTYKCASNAQTLQLSLVVVTGGSPLGPWLRAVSYQ
jgi:hypothetical protein